MNNVSGNTSSAAVNDLVRSIDWWHGIDDIDDCVLWTIIVLVGLVLLWHALCWSVKVLMK